MLELHASLRVQFFAGHCASVRDIAQALRLLDDAYAGLYRWLFWLTKPEKTGQLPPQEKLCLAALETVAPAQLEIVGGAAALNRLAVFLGQRRHDQRRSLADIALLQEDIAVARERGMAPAEIDRMLKRWVIVPLWALDEYRGSGDANDSGLILAAEGEEASARPSFLH